MEHKTEYAEVHREITGKTTAKRKRDGWIITKTWKDRWINM